MMVMLLTYCYSAPFFLSLQLFRLFCVFACVAAREFLGRHSMEEYSAAFRSIEDVLLFGPTAHSLTQNLLV